MALLIENGVHEDAWLRVEQTYSAVLETLAQLDCDICRDGIRPTCSLRHYALGDLLRGNPDQRTRDLVKWALQ
jgi:hypothetical protein